MRTLIGTVVALVMLGGCSPDAEPSPPPTPTGPVTTSPTPADTVTSTGPTPTSATTTSATTTEPPDSTTETSSPEATGAPTLPPEATEDTEAGAEAFARYYVETLNAALREPASSELASLSEADCNVCVSYLSYVDELQESDESYSSDLFAIVGSEASKVGESEYNVLLQVQQNAFQVVDAQGQIAHAEEAEDGLGITLTIARTENGGWRIVSGEFGKL